MTINDILVETIEILQNENDVLVETIVTLKNENELLKSELNKHKAFRRQLYEIEKLKRDIQKSKLEDQKMVEMIDGLIKDIKNGYY